MSSQVTHIARSIWFSQYSATNLIMFLAYFDDSGTDNRNPAIVAAGFAATVEQWDRFTSEWQRALNEERVNYFHAKQFFKADLGFGPYASWKIERRKDFLRRLLGIIGRRANKSFATAIRKTTYAMVIEPDPGVKHFFGTPFTFCSHHSVHGVLSWRDAGYRGTPVLFTFDKGNAREGELLRARERLKGSDRLIVDICTEDDQKLPPLQAADLLAYEYCRDLKRQDEGHPKVTRYPLQALYEHPHDWQYVDDPSELQSCVDEFRAVGYFLNR